MPFRLFGLTGGIASGKSLVARRFAARGVPIIDADQVARAVVLPGTDGLRAIVEAFGPTVLEPSGYLDRKRLAAIAFSDPSRRAVLNAITHPRIALATQAEADRIASSGAPAACYDAALLVENGLADAFRPLVVVAAHEGLQLARVVARDHMSEADARARIASQYPLASKVDVADIVIDNNQTTTQLLIEADVALDRVLAMLGLDPGSFPRPSS